MADEITQTGLILVSQDRFIERDQCCLREKRKSFPLACEAPWLGYAEGETARLATGYNLTIGRIGSNLQQCSEVPIECRKKQGSHWGAITIEAIC